MSLEFKCHTCNWKKISFLIYLCSFHFILDIEVSKYMIIYPTVWDNFVEFEYADEIYIFKYLGLTKGKIHFSNKNLTSSIINFFCILLFTCSNSSS